MQKSQADNDDERLENIGVRSLFMPMTKYMKSVFQMFFCYIAVGMFYG